MARRSKNKICGIFFTLLFILGISNSVLYAQEKGSGKTRIEKVKNSTQKGTNHHFADCIPSFNGNLGEYIENNLHYPVAASMLKAQGEVQIEFVVKKDGKIDSAVVFRSTGNTYLDKEALRLVQGMPPWNPGAQNGERVNVRMNLPITFKL